MHPGWYFGIVLFLWVFTSFTSWHIWKHVGSRRRLQDRVLWEARHLDLQRYRYESQLVESYGKPKKWDNGDECMKCVFWPIYVPGALLFCGVSWCYSQYTTALKRIADRL